MKQTYLCQCMIVLMLPVSMMSSHADVTKNCQQYNEQGKCTVTADDLPTVELAPISIVVNRMATPVPTYAGQVSVLGQKELVGSTNIIENLSQVPGFETGNDYGRHIGSQFRIRGFGYQSENRVIIEQDGVKRSPGMFSNHISSFRVDNNLLKNVEVVKGGSSVLHGGGAIGGIVSMKTKSVKDFLPAGKDYGVTIGGRIDSNNAQNGYVAFASKPKNTPIDVLLYGRMGHYGNVKLADDGVYSQTSKKQITTTPNDEDVDSVMVKLGWDINDEHRVALSHYKYHEKLATAWQTLWHMDLGANPVQGELKQDDTVLSYDYQPNDNDLVRLEGKLYNTKSSYYRTRDGKSPIQYRNTDKRWGANLKNHATFFTGSVINDLVVGMDYENRKEDAYMNNNGMVSDFGSMPNFYKDLGVYAQNNFDFGKADLTLGARYDRFERGVDRVGSQDYSKGRLSPKVALSYEPIEGVYLLVNYAETFRGPTPHETSSDGALNPHYWYVPNAGLKPEIAKEYEAGFALDKKVFGDDRLYLKATYFDGRIHDMISIKATPEMGIPPDLGDGYHDYRRYAQYQNISEAKRTGYELEAKYRYKDWYFGAGYDHMKITDTATDKRLQPSVDKVYFNASYEHADTGLSAGFKVTHWGHPKRDTYSYTQRGTTYHYINDDFTIADIRAGWNPKGTGVRFLDDDFKVNIGVNNLFDKQRIHHSSVTTTTSVGKGRNVFLAFEKRF